MLKLSVITAAATLFASAAIAQTMQPIPNPPESPHHGKMHGHQAHSRHVHHVVHHPRKPS